MAVCRSFVVVLCLFTVSHCAPTNDELSAFMTSIWQDDVNAAPSVSVNKQGHTSSASTSDHASRALFSYVNEQYYFSQPTYTALINLLDNYNHQLGQAEHTTDHESVEETRFLDEISKTSVMQQTLTFLNHHGYVGSDWASLATELRRIWFSMYPRHGHTYDSSGFEHVFVGEMNDTGVIGFHNWIQFYRQEQDGNLDYQGYIFSKMPNVIGTHFIWLDRIKPLGSFMYGTSPEFDIAMYTVCYFARRNRACDFSIDGHSVEVKAYDITHGGGHHLGSAYVS